MSEQMPIWAKIGWGFVAFVAVCMLLRSRLRRVSRVLVDSARAEETQTVARGTPVATAAAAVDAALKRIKPKRKFRPSSWLSAPSDSEVYLKNLKETFKRCPFYQGEWREALQQARQLNRLLFIVIIKPPTVSAPDTFTREVLNTDLITDILEVNYVSWIGIANSSEVKDLPLHRAQHYPYILIVDPEAKKALISCTAPLTSSELMKKLVEGMETKELLAAHGYAQLDEKFVREQNLRMERELKLAQDREYEEALLRDREAIDRNRELERKKAEEELERQREEQARKQLADAQELRQKRREQLLSSLPPEPLPSPTVASVCVRLPNGKKLVRNFNLSSPLQDVLHFVDGQELINTEGTEIIPPTLSDSPSHSPLYPTSYPYRLVTNHPRRVWEDSAISLKELGLGRNILFYVDPME